MTTARIRLLIAEDQIATRRALGALFEAEPDMDVIGLAADGAEALRLVRLERPDVALLDIKMPRLDGIEAAKQIAWECPRTRVVMLTTFDADDLIFQAILAGAIGYLVKDAEEAEILATVRDAARDLSRLSPGIARRLIEDFRRMKKMRGAVSEKIAGESLTERESLVLDLIGSGKSNRDIGVTLGLAEGTVKNHVSSILSKLHARSRTELAVKSLRQAL